VFVENGEEGNHDKSFLTGGQHPILYVVEETDPIEQGLK
jgi:hypothetical protein